MTKGEKHRKTRKRNIQKRTAWALRKIRKHNPKNLLETSQLGLVLAHHGEGAFRKTYRIAGTTLLIKFPITQDPAAKWSYRTDHEHSRSEVRKIRTMQTVLCLRKHVPPVYYSDSQSGVIVTKFYPRKAAYKVESAMNRLLSDLIRQLTGVRLDDTMGDNLKVDERGRLIFVDLGY